jgi:hypothetical protein
VMSHGLFFREFQFFRVASREHPLAQPLACAACDPRTWLGHEHKARANRFELALQVAEREFVPPA